MFIRGLKAKIAINIAVLLFLAMLLIDLVTIVTVKRELIRSEVFKANILLTSFEHSIVNGIPSTEGRPNPSPLRTAGHPNTSAASSPTVHRAASIHRDECWLDGPLAASSVDGRHVSPRVSVISAFRTPSPFRC